MAFVALRCPNCSGDIQLDDSKEFGFCLYCGSKVMIQREVGSDSVRTQLSNLKPILERSFKDGDYKKTLEFSEKLIAENAADADVWYMRGMCLALTDGFEVKGDRDEKSSYSLKPTKEAESCFYNYTALSGKEVDFYKESLPIYEDWAKKRGWFAARWITFCYGLGLGTEISYEKAVYYYLAVTSVRTAENIEDPIAFYMTYVPVSVLTGDGCIRVPYQLSEFGDYDFLGLKGQFTVDGRKLRRIGKCCFKSSGLTKIALPNTMESIGEEAFMNSDLESIDIPSSIETIEARTFYGCKKLKKVSIPDTVEEIRERAFGETVSLTSLVIPPSVKLVGRNVVYCNDRRSRMTVYVYGNPRTCENAFADGKRVLPCNKMMEPEDYGKDPSESRESKRGIRGIFGKN